MLDVGVNAKNEEIKKAYRSLARQHHPDKGGDSALFGQIQHAYEVLSDSKRRQVYDTWAKELQYRYVRSTTGAALGGEDILLDEFESLGMHCDPATQLVVTCEVCRRPATKQCWTCSMHICEFCTLKRHWTDGVPLHWPLINSDHMRERLAKRELEKKRIDDAKRLALEDPNHRSERELKDIRAFKDVAYEMLKRDDRHTVYDLRTARFYMWAQTPMTVFLVCRVPTGYSDRELVFECSGSTLLVQSEDSPPLIERRLAYGVDTSRAIETIRTTDNRICAIAIPKSEPGQQWKRIFEGDSDGIRCIHPPYELFETEEDAMVQIELPFWIDTEDVRVEFGATVLSVEVRNTMNVQRTYWRNLDEHTKRRDYRVINQEECCWSLEEDTDAKRERCKVLTVTLARPEPTEEEIQWKKGTRQDNRAAERPGSLHERGYRFFADDEDDFNLEEVLQALCFAEVGEAYVAPKPWRHGEEPRWAKEEWSLPPGARALLQTLREMNGGKQIERVGNGAGAGAAKEE